MGGDLVSPAHKDGDPDTTNEEYNQDNHYDQEDPNSEESDEG
jgi:hypothetical protein